MIAGPLTFPGQPGQCTNAPEARDPTATALGALVASFSFRRFRCVVFVQSLRRCDNAVTLRPRTTAGVDFALVRVEPRQRWTDDDLACMMFDDDGSGAAITVPRAGTDAERLVQVADQLQDVVMETRWSHRLPATWPECPLHPSSHPLQPVVVDEEALWTCPLDAAVRIAIGSLR